MKKINVEKSTVFERNISSLKESFTYLNEEGFFSNFEDFSEYEEGILNSVRIGNGIYYPYECKSINRDYKYFIPKSLAVFEEPEEKKYRPYMYLDELPFNIGDVVIYRCKQCCSESKGLVTAIEYQNDDDCELDNIIIGGINGTPQELFDYYELLDDNCQYRPFGVEE